MKNNRTLWIVLGVAGGLLGLCCLGVVVVTGAVGLWSVNLQNSEVLPVATQAEIYEAVVPSVTAAAGEPAPEEEATPAEAPTEAPDEPSPTEEPAEATETPEPTQEPSASSSGNSSGASATGEQVEAGSTALTVLAVTNVPDFSGFTPAVGSLYLDVEVELENTGTETLYYSPVNFKIEDDEGSQHSHSWESLQPALSSGELAPGDSVRGHLTFEVPGQPGDRFELVFRPADAAEEATIRIRVEAPAP